MKTKLVETMSMPINADMCEISVLKDNSIFNYRVVEIKTTNFLNKIFISCVESKKLKTTNKKLQEGFLIYSSQIITCIGIELTKDDYIEWVLSCKPIKEIINTQNTLYRIKYDDEFKSISKLENIDVCENTSESKKYNFHIINHLMGLIKQ
jgi:hypothetical protein